MMMCPAHRPEQDAIRTCRDARAARRGARLARRGARRPRGGASRARLGGRPGAGGGGGGAAEGRRERGEAGVLTLAAAPIGRAEDASARLVAALAEATLIAAEDTRRVRWLASHLNVELKARVVSYYDAVETRRTPGLLGDLQAGQDIPLLTHARTPAISDPGYRLVAAAAAAGLRVTALPGPSAVTTALAVSGL